MPRPDPYDTRSSATNPGVQGPIPQAPAGRVGIRPAAPTVTAPRSATSTPNAPAGDGQGSDPVKAPVAAPVGTRFAVPAGPSPTADAMNAEYDKQGYGPHSTETQVDQARGQRNANQAYGNLAPTPGVGTAVYRGGGNMTRVGVAPSPAPTPGQPAQPEADWQTKAKGSPAGSPEWRQQFWKYDAKTGQHTFDHGGEARARQGLGIGSQGTEPRDLAREAIVEQLKYHQDMARTANNMGGGLLNGSDGASWGNAVLHHAHALQAHDASVAAVKAGDATGQLAALTKMSPEARAIYLASKGVDGATIAGLPQPQAPGQSPFNATNIETAGATNPQTRDATAILSDPNLEFHQKAAMFAGIPGVENPNSPHRQLWDAFMARNQARGHEFDQEMGQYNPQDPTGAKVYDTSNPVAALGSIFGAAKDSIFGGDPAIPARNRALQAHMGKLGYGAVPTGGIGVPTTAQQVLAQQVGVRRGQE